MPGVLRVFTAQGFRGRGRAALRLAGDRPHGQPMQEPKHPVLAEGKVRHVGDPIAAVVAETYEQARDAAEAIVVDIEELPAVVDMKAALAEGAPKVHDDLSSNLCYDWGFVEENRAAVDEAFAKAAHVTTLELVNNRLVANPMEPRVAVGDYDPLRDGDSHALHHLSQNPHVIRLLMGAFVLGIPEHKLRVVAPDVGGGFGSKIFHYAEEAFCTFAAKAARPAGEVDGERSRLHVGRAWPRPCHEDRAGAGRRRAQLPAIRTETYANMGAYLSTFAPSVPTWLHGTLMAGNYKTPLIYVNVKAVFTNTVPVDAYRGAGRPEATFQLERVIDKAARELGSTRSSCGGRTSSPQFPYQTPVAVVYDTGNYHATMDKLARDRRRRGLRGARKESEGARQAARPRHQLLHRGLRHRAVEPGGAARRARGALRSATVRVNATGSVVMTGSHSHGQGHETTFAAGRRRDDRHRRIARSRSCMATPPTRRWAWAPTARARSRWAARPSCGRPTRSSTRPRRSRRICWRPRRPISS
jgi:aerobic carbon-monoxide dehydrogenase large subunit